MKKKSKRILTPKLRFPEFRETEAWSLRKLSGFLVERRQRNRQLKYDKQDVLSVSGEHGCVNQIELLGRSYAGVSVKEYHIVEIGDIVYTKSPLKLNPYGIIKENKEKPGIVSTLYAVYHTTAEGHPAYLDHYFSRDYNLNSYLQPIVRKGAKNDMKVNNCAVLGGEIYIPKLEEQKKIADCLSSLYGLITAESRMLEALKAHKKGLMQQLFPQPGETKPRLRFPEFRVQWDKVRLSQLANSISDRVGTMPCIPYTVTSGLGLMSQEEKYGRTIAGDSLRNYIRLQKDDFAYNKSATKEYPQGYIARYLDQAKAAVPNSIFTCFRVNSDKVDPAFLDFLFTNNLHGRWLRNFITIGARTHGTLNFSHNDLMTLPVPLPSLSEQHKIADCLTALDIQITAQAAKINTLKQHKRGLMQQLFPAPEEL